MRLCKRRLHSLWWNSVGVVVISGLLSSTAVPCSGASTIPGSFDPTARGFSLSNASFLVSVVEVAGQNDEGRIRIQMSAVGLSSARLIKDKVLHCVVAENDSYLVLAFRGSTTMQDWLTDLKFTQAKEKSTGLPGRVHRGFVRALDEGWPRIAELLARADKAGKTIWITGHSLGGGLSHIAAMRAALEGIPIAGIYTFASPRVGDDEFVKAFNRQFSGRSYRVVNVEDLVPHVPPTQPAEKEFAAIVAPTKKKLGVRLAAKGAFMMVRYTHAGELFVFDERGVFRGRQNTSDQDDVRYWKEVESEYGTGSWTVIVDDQGNIARKHFLNAYVKVLHRATSH